MILQKLGEEKELTEPFPMKVCYTKKNSNTFSSRTYVSDEQFIDITSHNSNIREMLGKVLTSELVFHNYGVSICNKIEGTNVCFTELFKRITPRISGYFIFESEVCFNDKGRIQ